MMDPKIPTLKPSLHLKTEAKTTMTPDPKTSESEIDDAKDAAIAELTREVLHLKEQLVLAKSNDASVYASNLVLLRPENVMEIPRCGRNPRQVKEYILSFHELDNRPRLNTSSVGLCVTHVCMCVLWWSLESIAVLVHDFGVLMMHCFLRIVRKCGL
jgi:hypothetical protein